MPALKPTDYTAEIVWLGVVDDRPNSLRASAVQTMGLGFGGLDGEEHAGRTRPSCSRVISQHPRGTEIANTRQVSIIAQEELADIAAAIDMPDLSPAYLGASIMLRGLPDFTHLPPSSRLQGPDGVTLVIDMHNRPCHLPAKEIDDDAPGHGKAFKSAAEGKRGVTAWVERPGTLELGQTLRLHIPDQRAWAHLDAARSQ